MQCLFDHQKNFKRITQANDFEVLIGSLGC